MKTKHFCMLLLTVGLFAACEKSTKLTAPSGLQGQQMGNSIVLAWNRVDGAISCSTACSFSAKSTRRYKVSNASLGKSNSSGVANLA